MDFSVERHVVNLSAGGCLGATGLLHTPPESLKHIFEGLETSRKSRMTICFHGGLIDEVMGLGLARLLYSEISENCDSYPVFFLWESGLLETIQSSMVEIVESSPLWGRILKHLMRSLSRLVPRPGPESVEAEDIARLTRGIEAERLFLDEPAVLALLDSQTGRGLRSLSDADLCRLQQDLAADPQADRALGAIMAAARRGASVPAVEAASASGARSAAETGYLSQAILRRLANPSVPATPADAELMFEGLAGLTSPSDWFFAGDVLCKIVDRFQNGTDHGFVGTILEEMYRTLYADMVGRFLWDGMKANAKGAYDAVDPNKPDEETPGGSLFLQLFKEYQDQHGPVELNLIGHSAGSIHICHFLAKAAKVLDADFTFKNVIFLAPACNFSTFHKEVVAHRRRVDDFRIFTMSDTYEQRDPLIKLMPMVYPHSLLYLVSGLFEDAPDTPLLGLARHLEGDTIPLLAEIRDFLEQFEPPAVVYSKTTEDAPAGEQAGFTSHYGLWGPNFDRATLDSVADMIRPAAIRELNELAATGPAVPPSETPTADAVPAPSWTWPADFEHLGPAAAGEVASLGFGEPGDVLEQVFGPDDIVDHAVIDALLRAGRAVARIVAPGIDKFSEVEPAQRSAVWAQAKQTGQIFDGYGTGWVLGSARRILITNNHVLPLPEAAAAASVEFGFERDLRRGVRAKFVARLRPGELFITDPNMAFGGLDYTVVALSREAPEEFSFLEPVPGVTAVGAANIFIVQHPGGAGKAYVLTGNRRVSLPERYVTYLSDTLEGSSGSALFDDRVRLVGIHHLGNYAEHIGDAIEQVNLGSRIECVIEDIARKLRAMSDWDEEKVRYWFGDGLVLTIWRRLAET